MNLTGPAAARLYDEHVDAVYAAVARRVGPELAVEIVAEVFEHALRRQLQDPPGPGRERGWLFAIATAMLRRHSAAEHARLLAWDEVTDGQPAGPATTDPLLAAAGDRGRSDIAAVMAAVAELEPADRDLLLLSSWERCSAEELSEALRMPPGAIRTRLRGVRKELRQRTAAAGRGAEE